VEKEVFCIELNRGRGFKKFDLPTHTKKSIRTHTEHTQTHTCSHNYRLNFCKTWFVRDFLNSRCGIWRFFPPTKRQGTLL